MLIALTGDDLTITWSIHVHNSPGMAVGLSGGSQHRVHGYRVSVDLPGLQATRNRTYESVNAACLMLSDATNVHVSGVHLVCGDDNIAMNAEGAPFRDVLIEDSYFGWGARLLNWIYDGGHGCSIRSMTQVRFGISIEFRMMVLQQQFDFENMNWIYDSGWLAQHNREENVEFCIKNEVLCIETRFCVLKTRFCDLVPAGATLGPYFVCFASIFLRSGLIWADFGSNFGRADVTVHATYSRKLHPTQEAFQQHQNRSKTDPKQIQKQMTWIVSCRRPLPVACFSRQ